MHQMMAQWKIYSIKDILYFGISRKIAGIFEKFSCVFSAWFTIGQVNYSLYDRCEENICYNNEVVRKCNFTLF